MQTWINAFSWINIRFLLLGLKVTLGISVIVMVLSFVIGSLMGILRFAKIKYVSVTVGFIVDVVRNLPLLLIIFFTYFGLPNFGFRPDVIPAAIIAMTVFESGMIAEIVRSGIQSVATGQMEGARSTGMNFAQAMWHVVLPQAYKHMVPTLVSQLVSLIKDTSLATIIVVPEMTQQAQIVYGQNANFTLPMFVALALLYFVVCFALSLVGSVVGKQLN
ncbi:amino acid ABC transporter permease [Lactobacillus sp. ESL0731]|uniref:amino acid ABC transporter permease n=1 Tax=unclassified Lactobacillus TaxID=2620435 RepID=UPI0023F69DA9|nr:MULTISPECIES: amino acid ABC transporter permease [unclassified Lactobacillus]WEV50562.1 amino acid ABC transporter permease [Lactobacillus sp. ESL0700]WEV61692.1 amino acid ABC transporter permease [Lactobacillus sp. ESL0731]